jgi:hypothetical protein
VLGDPAVNGADHFSHAGRASQSSGIPQPLIPVRPNVQPIVATPGANHAGSKPQQFNAGTVVVTTEPYFMAACLVEAKNAEFVDTLLTHVAERHMRVRGSFRSGCYDADVRLSGCGYGTLTFHFFKRFDGLRHLHP